MDISVDLRAVVVVGFSVIVVVMGRSFRALASPHAARRVVASKMRDTRESGLEMGMFDMPDPTAPSMPRATRDSSSGIRAEVPNVLTVWKA
jgi:hypothetical protein